MALICNHPDGLGVIILSAGADSGGEIRSQALRQISTDGDIVYIGLDEDAIDATIDDMEDLGAPTGYYVDIVNEAPDTVRTHIMRASMVVLVAGGTVRALRERLIGTLADALLQAYARGAVVLIEGYNTVLFGQYALTENGDVTDGFNWLEGAIVVPFDGDVSVLDSTNPLLLKYPSAYLVGIRLGSALTLMSANKVETWGGLNRYLLVRLGNDLISASQDNE